MWAWALAEVSQAADVSNTSWPQLAFVYGPAAGILATVVWFLISGKLVSGKEHDRVVAEKDAALTRANELEATMRRDVIPVMVRFVDLQTAELTGRHPRRSE